MKKLLSLVMAGAMVLSLVPATAFAKGEVTATATVVDAWKKTKDFTGSITGSDVPELKLKVTGVNYQQTGSVLPEAKVKITLDNAEFISETDLLNGVSLSGAKIGTPTAATSITVYSYTALTAAQIETALKAYYANATDLTDVRDISTLATFDTNHQGNSFTFSGSVANPITKSAAAVEQEALDAYIASVNTLPATDATHADYDYISNSPLYGQVYVKDTASTNEGPAYILKSDLLAYKNVSAFAPEKTLEATWLTTATTALAGNKLYKETSKTTTSTAPETGVVRNIAVTIGADDYYKDQATITFTGYFEKDDVISIDLSSTMTSKSEGKKATVSVDSKMVTASDLVYASILGKGLTATVRKVVDVAEDEVVKLNSNGMKIEAAVGDLPSKVTLKISNGFEFTKANGGLSGTNYDVDYVDEKELTVNVSGSVDEITVKNLEIEAASAKSGAVATITVKASNNDSASCEVAKVVDYKVNLTVDEDEDVPVIYSGTNVANTGLTDDSDHMSLEVTAEETFPGAWSMRQGFNFNLPDGVYVTKVDVTDTENFVYTVNNVKNDVDDTKWEEAFFDAYQNGDHKNFEFKKRVFDDVNQELETKPAKVTFQLQLVADPTFEGDVVVTFEGSLVDTQSVTIAKFVKPYTVKAEQNDVIIDYRNTAINTAITITEAAEGLLKENTEFTLLIEDNLIDFDGDPKVAADDASEMTIKDDDTTNGTFVFEIDDESDSAATITISDMELFMNRSIPAGGYDLKISTTMSKAYDAQVLFAPDNATTYAGMAAAVTAANAAWVANARTSANTTVKDTYIDDVTDYSSTVKEAFINVVTSGRDQDNLFTTKVVVPVGEGYLVAGETKVTLDAPAYISAAGYTMLPVRAVSRALGVDTNNVLWSAETKTVTIMFAQRIISMTVGQKTIYVNGSAIPSSAAPEIKDGRTFLPLRDLGTALGVTNVSWDSATKTATLN